MIVSAPVPTLVVPGSPGYVPLPFPAVQALAKTQLQNSNSLSGTDLVTGLSVPISPFQRLVIRWEIGLTQGTFGGGVQFGVQLPGDGNVVNVMGVVYGSGMGPDFGQGSGQGSVIAFIGSSSNWKNGAATIIGLFQAGPTAGTVDLLFSANNSGTATVTVASCVLAVEA